MAGFLYFLPDGAAALPKGRTPDADLLARLELGHLAGATLAVNYPRSGPAGKYGVVFADEQAVHPVGYYPDKQSWHDAGAFWLGIVTDSPPGPTDLARPQRVAGSDVTLADGSAWHVPALRYLPQTLRLNRTSGLVERTPRPEFAAINALAERCWSDVVADALIAVGETPPADWVRLSEAQQLVLAVGALAINYRLGVAEVNAAGLLTDATLTAVLRAVLDFDALVALTDGKKKTAAAAPSSPG